jgi:signal peptidase II
MKKEIYRYSFSLMTFVAVVVIDYFTKEWASTYGDGTSFTLFKINFIKNDGFILGSFSSLPTHAKLAIIYSFGTFVFSTYLFFLWLSREWSRFSQYGITLLTAGILSNVIDRLDDRSVVDFISISFLNVGNFIFNLADVFQIIGHLSICTGLYFDSKYFWPKNDWRMKYIVNKKFQTKASLFIFCTTFSACMMTSVFSYFFLSVGQGNPTMKIYVSATFVLGLVFSIFTSLLTLVLSHRIAGPIYAVQRFLNRIIEDQSVAFKLRKNDEFKELEDTMNLLKTKFGQTTLSFHVKDESEKDYANVRPIDFKAHKSKKDRAA